MSAVFAENPGSLSATTASKHLNAQVQTALITDAVDLKLVLHALLALLAVPMVTATSGHQAFAWLRAHSEKLVLQEPSLAWTSLSALQENALLWETFLVVMLALHPLIAKVLTIVLPQFAPALLDTTVPTKAPEQ